MASVVANALPEGVAVPLATRLAELASRLPAFASRRALVARHQARAQPRAATTVTRSKAGRAKEVRAAFGSYGRYWVESLRLPGMDPQVVASRFTIEGLAHIERAREAGTGAILAIPHLGGWEVGGSWFVTKGFPLTVVVEAVEPPELFAWFRGLRESFGFKVIPLGPAAGTAVVRALRANEVVALLADRDIGGGGVGVEFLGEVTTLPAGPAALARRLGAPLLPTAIYFDGRGHRAVVRPPVDLSGTTEEVTQRLADELAAFIRAAPQQWHLFQPNWPSDIEAAPGGKT